MKALRFLTAGEAVSYGTMNEKMRLKTPLYAAVVEFEITFEEKTRRFWRYPMTEFWISLPSRLDWLKPVISVRPEPTPATINFSSLVVISMPNVDRSKLAVRVYGSSLCKSCITYVLSFRIRGDTKSMNRANPRPRSMK